MLIDFWSFIGDNIFRVFKFYTFRRFIWIFNFCRGFRQVLAFAQRSRVAFFDWFYLQAIKLFLDGAEDEPCNPDGSFQEVVDWAQQKDGKTDYTCHHQNSILVGSHEDYEAGMVNQWVDGFEDGEYFPFCHVEWIKEGDEVAHTDADHEVEGIREKQKQRIDEILIPTPPLP